MYFQYFLITSGKGTVFDWKFLDPVQKLSINYFSSDSEILEIHLASQNIKDEHIIHMTSYNQYLIIVYCVIQLRVRWNTWKILVCSGWIHTIYKNIYARITLNIKSVISSCQEHCDEPLMIYSETLFIIIWIWIFQYMCALFYI